MKLLNIFIGLLCLSQTGHSFADESMIYKLLRDAAGISTYLDGIYSYNDFKYNSTRAGATNKYDGYTNVYGGGADYVPLTNKLYGGLFIFNADTHVSSNFLFNQLSIVKAHQTIENNNLFGHLFYQLSNLFYFDVAGGVGQFYMNYNSTLNLDPIAQGRGNASGDDWFVSATGIVAYPWNDFLITGSAQVMYSEMTQNPYFIGFAPDSLFVPIERFHNNTTFTIENIEIAYKKYTRVQPFINGGLMQVPQYNNSRPIFDQFGVAALPEFNLNENGYQVGGGIALHYKQWELRVAQQYYQRGSVFHNNQTRVVLKLALE